jgi:hypothetical protein
MIYFFILKVKFLDILYIQISLAQGIYKINLKVPILYTILEDYYTPK